MDQLNLEQINDWVDDLSNGKFIALQILVGLASAIGGGCCILFLGNNETDFNSFGLAGAFVLCGGLPTLIRSRIERPTPWFRWSIIAGLVIMLGVYALVRF